jgi:hypothetical protein
MNNWKPKLEAQLRSNQALAQAALQMNILLSIFAAHK